MSKKTYIHRNVNMMLYSHHMSPLLCWHNNVQTKCSTVVLENILKNMSTLKNKKSLRFSHVPQNMSPCLHISHVPKQMSTQAVLTQEQNKKNICRAEAEAEADAKHWQRQWQSNSRCKGEGDQAEAVACRHKLCRHKSKSKSICKAKA